MLLAYLRYFTSIFEASDPRQKLPPLHIYSEGVVGLPEHQGYQFYVTSCLDPQGRDPGLYNDDGPPVSPVQRDQGKC